MVHRRAKNGHFSISDVRPAPIESGNYSLISRRDNVEQFKKRLGITLTGLLLAYVSWWVRGLVNGSRVRGARG